jgi:hypothetical protein
MTVVERYEPHLLRDLSRTLPDPRDVQEMRITPEWYEPLVRAGSAFGRTNSSLWRMLRPRGWLSSTNSAPAKGKRV